MPAPVTSGTYTFTQSATEIITAALRLAQVIGDEETATGSQLQSGMDALNAMVKTWGISGKHVWTQETLSVTPTAGKAQYQVGIGAPDISVVRPLKISGGRKILTSTQGATPLVPMSRLDYANLSGKTLPTGQPEFFFYDPQLPYGILTLYPAPADTLSTYNFTAQRPIQDFADLSNAPDFPVEWFSALKFALAMEVGPEYGIPPDQFAMLKEQAESKIQMLVAWDQELQGTTSFPFTQSVYQVIARSLRLCKATGPQDVPSLGLVNNAFMSLNAMIQEWQATGIHVWCEEECILFPQAGQVQYALSALSSDHACLYQSLIQTSLASVASSGATALNLVSAIGIANGDNIGVQLDSGVNFWTTVSGAPVGNTVNLAAPLPSQASAAAIVFDYSPPLTRPLRVMGGRRYSYAQRIDIPMLPFARLDYAMQPNKYTPGVITQYFFDPQTSPTQYGSPQAGSSLVNLWPSPQDNTFGFRFTAQRPITALADLTSAMDFPVEWFNAIAFNLAVDLAPEHGLGGDDLANLTVRAAMKLQTAQSWDREPESILFGVAFAPGYRRG